MKRRAGLLALLAAAGYAARPAAVAQPAQEKLRQILERVRPSAAAGRLAATTPEEEHALLRQRAALLAEGEDALARLDTAAAESAFDRAALILHAADTEMGLVRTYMQSGAYRRALAFGAHTAGAHLDVVGGAAMYAWLLHLGGQVDTARRLLAEASARTPGNQLVASVSAQLRADLPRATRLQLEAPVRLAPYATSIAIAGGARTAGSAVLVDGGTRALVAAPLVQGARSLWLRNGLGQTVSARVAHRLPHEDIAVLQLAKRLPPPEGVQTAAKEPFPGSVAFAVEFVAGDQALPAWPVLRSGFLGQPDGSRAGNRVLGVPMPAGPRGGPVYDRAGQWIGMAVRVDNHDRLIPAARLKATAGEPQAAASAAPVNNGAQPMAIMAPDQLYENALRQTLQLITAT